MSRYASIGVGLFCITITFELLSVYDDSAVSLLTSFVDVKLVTLKTRRVVTLQESEWILYTIKVSIHG